MEGDEESLVCDLYLYEWTRYSVLGILCGFLELYLSRQLSVLPASLPLLPSLICFHVLKLFL